MPQIMIIGIGGLDADLLRVYGPSLPNLRRLMLESPFLELRSTIPPEPVPSWTSVYTGLNPANHGMLEKMDCLERSLPDLQFFKEELFWEKAARAGKRVCVLNPLLARSKGLPKSLTLAQAGSPESPQENTFPNLLDEPLIPPSSQLAGFCTSLRERTEQQVKVALDFWAREPWDLFFVQLDALDHVQHFLWRYSDPGDPMYPGKNEHTSRILDFYRLFDQVIGRFRSIIPPECVLLVVSSHGHERRCTHRFHVNEWLYEQHFLQPENPGKVLAGESFSSWLLSHLPWNRGRRGGTHSIDQEQSIAQLVELASATSSYGGVKLNQERLQQEQQDYEQVRESIVLGLEQFCFKDNPVVNWAKKREQCYQGKQLNHYPDIIFELRGDFGVGRGLNAPLIIPDSTHRLISGAHSTHGVLLLENWPPEVEIYGDFQGPSVMDVAPTVLHLLDVECSALDGHALVRPLVVRQLI